MCMVDFSDGRVTVIRDEWRKARKAHKCNECFRVIAAGERYSFEFFTFDGDCNSHRTCEHCMVVRGWLTDECGGFLYGGVEEDIHEHASEGYGFRVKLLSIGISRNWRRKDGRMWPVPRPPKTTLEIAKGPQ